MHSPRIQRPFLSTLALAAALAVAACDGPTPLGPPEPGEIRGRFIRFDGSPMPGVPIRIGDQRTVTGSNGGFRFTGVDTPYDLVIGYPLAVFVYEDVTRNDPIITDPDTRVGYSHVTTLNGQVPVAPALETLVFVTGAYPSAPWRYADPPTGAYQMKVFWDGSADSRYATLYALRRRDAVIVDLPSRCGLSS